MNNLYIGLVLLGCVNCAPSKNCGRLYTQEKEHGYHGLVLVDCKTGLLRPPGILDNFKEQLSVYNKTYAHHWCKHLDSKPFWDDAYKHNLCSRKENGTIIDLCCTGRKCTSYGLKKGHYCARVISKGKMRH